MDHGGIAILTPLPPTPTQLANRINRINYIAHQTGTQNECGDVGTCWTYNHGQNIWNCAGSIVKHPPSSPNTMLRTIANSKQHCTGERGCGEVYSLEKV